MAAHIILASPCRRVLRGENQTNNPAEQRSVAIHIVNASLMDRGTGASKEQLERDNLAGHHKLARFQSPHSKCDKAASDDPAGPR